MLFDKRVVPNTIAVFVLLSGLCLSQTLPETKALEINNSLNTQAVEPVVEQDNNVQKSLAKPKNSTYILTSQAPNRSTSAATLYDFTEGSDKYYGGTSAAKDLGDGNWGMIAGDADGSGSIGASDRNMTWNERTDVGYLDTDCDLNGNIGAADRNITWNNRTLITQVP